MLITISDIKGLVSIAINNNGVSFVDGKAYFTDIDGDDWKVDVTQIHVIGF